MIVEKAVNMAAMMHIPVLGLVENMSYILCPDCGKKISVFGESHVDDIAKRHGITAVARLPMNPALAAACDKGQIEQFDGPGLDSLLETVLAAKKEDKPWKFAAACTGNNICQHFGHCENFRLFETDQPAGAFGNQCPKPRAQAGVPAQLPGRPGGEDRDRGRHRRRRDRDFQRARRYGRHRRAGLRARRRGSVSARRAGIHRRAMPRARPHRGQLRRTSLTCRIYSN